MEIEVLAVGSLPDQQNCAAQLNIRSQVSDGQNTVYRRVIRQKRSKIVLTKYIFSALLNNIMLFDIYHC